MKKFILPKMWLGPLVLALTLLMGLHTTRAQTPEQDSLALVALYNSTDGSNWDNNTGWLTDSVKNWYGVTVESGRVTEISMHSNGLSGYIPVQLEDLSNLTRLRFSLNALTDSIPPAMGNLSNLTYLNVNGNQLSGPIPAEFGNLASLEQLILSGNQLTGNIPSTLGNLSQLIRLWLNNNDLGGGIPQEIGNLSNLQGLDLESNNFIGNLPASLGNLTNLSYLNVRYNNLQGELPAELSNLTSLSAFVASDNNFEGNIPYEWKNLTKWRDLIIGGNGFTSLPNLSGQANLARVTIDNNRLDFVDLDTLNVEWSNLNYYDYAPQASFPLQVDTSAGNVTATVPDSIPGTNGQFQWFANGDTIVGETAASYTYSESSFDDYHCAVTNPDYPNLTLYSDTLVGGEPPVSQIDSLALVALYDSTDGSNWDNNTGWLTDSVKNWYGITVENGRVTEIDLYRNSLSGSIPMELGNLTNLEWLILGINSLSGSIPAELGNLSNLSRLKLERNSFTGSVPAELGNLTNLQVLVLRRNSFSGSIPADLGNLTNLQHLDFDDNSLSGTIPAELGNLSNLQSFDLKRNALSGSIPAELGNLSNLQSLELRSNFLSGSIPAELGNLANLSYLYLDDNAFDALPDLSGLTALNKSYVNDNRLDFEDLDSASIDWDGLDFYEYSPQFSFPLQVDTSSGNVTATVPDSIPGTNGQFQWFMDGDTIVGETAASYTYSESSASDYHCAVTNPDYPDLTLYSDTLEGGATPVSQTDSLALVTLYNVTNGDNWDNNTGWLNDSVKNWYGVTVDEDGYVTQLDLSGSDDNNFNMTDSIPAEIGDLDSLEVLNLRYNNLSGSIPAELGNLSNLKELFLGHNSLSGSIPTELGNLSNLEELSLIANSLSSSIPSELGNLSNLRDLWLAKNSLSDSIPSELGNLSNLRDLWLFSNSLSGSIPSELGNLSNLGSLHLHENFLSGSIPSELDNLSNLRYLTLHENSLSGSIPSELGNLSNLEMLKFYNNSLTNLPDLSGLTSLSSVYIQNNCFDFSDLDTASIQWTDFDYYDYAPQASVPLQVDTASGNVTATVPDSIPGTNGQFQWFMDGDTIVGETAAGYTYSESSASDYHCAVTNPDYPDLTLYSDTLVGGEPPVSQTDSLALVTLYNVTNGDNWDNNTGWLTDSVKNWYGVTVESGRVTEIDLSGSYETNFNMTDSLPAEIGNLDSLEVLNLEYNNLSGSIPAELGNLENVERLNLSGNSLSGIIPTELSNLTNLGYLKLGWNSLSGIIPTELSNLTNLVYLNLGWNSLSGNIPMELSNLANLQHLYLWGNSLSGSIPAELGNLENLERLYLDRNSLSGSIPAELGNLENLERLYLDRNSLSGTIPTELASLANLQWLDLEGNSLSGSIPVELGNLANLQRLRLGDNAFDALPDLSGLTALNSSRVNDNRFDFGDLETASIDWGSLDDYDYAPQASFLLQVDTASGSVTATVPDSIPGINGQFQWFANGDTIVGETAASYTYSESSASDYHCAVTNPDYPDLTLYSDTLENNPQVTFSVDMRLFMKASSEFDPANDEVYVTGSFANWEEPGVDPDMQMQDADGDSTYTLTRELDTGYYEYKYFYVPAGQGSTWAYGEWDGTNNRSFNLALGDTTLANTWGMEPAMQVSANSLEIDAPAGESNATSFMIENTGTGVLDISTIATAHPQFTVDTSSAYLLGNESLEVTVRFTADAESTVQDTLTISSNDSQAPVYEIPLSGEAVSAPEMAVLPEMYDVIVAAGDVLVRNLVVDNSNGQDTLDWQVQTPASWITFDATSGFTPAGEKDTVEVTLQSAGLVEDTYQDVIVVSGNDPVNPEDTVYTTMFVDGEPAASLNASAFAFGEVFVNGTGTDTLAIQNTGWDSLEVDLTGLTAPFTADTSALVVPPDTTGYILLQFTPASLGSFSGTLNLSTNAGNFALDVSGEGTEAPQFAITPDSIGANITQCGDSVTHTLTVENTGGSDLEYQLYGDASSSYDSTSVVYFTTDGEATDHNFSDITYADTLYITVTTNGDYDSGSEYASVYIDGEFIEDIEDNDVENGTEIITDYTFSGSQLEDWLQDDQVTVTIQNSGAVGAFSVNLHQVQVQGKGASWMEVQQPNGTLPAGDLAGIDVQFNADGLEAGVYEADIQVSSNDPVTPTVQIPAYFNVEGNPSIAVSANAFNFSEVFVNDHATDTLTLYNSGCDTLKLTDITGTTGEFAVDTAELDIMPYDSAQIAIAFAPAGTGNFSETLTLNTNAGNASVDVSGQGISAPEMAISPDSLPASVTQCGDSVTQTLTIENTGGNELTYTLANSSVKRDAKDFLIIDHGKDKNPFSGYEYETITEAGFSALSADELLNFKVVYFEPEWNDYANLTANMAHLEEYMNAGGVVVLNIAGNIGSANDIGPFGTDYSRSYTHSYEDISLPDHGYITGQGYSGNQLVAADFNSWGSTDHGTLSNYPPESEVVLSNAHGASWIQFPSQNGQMIITTLTYGWVGPAEPLSNLVDYANYTASTTSASWLSFSTTEDSIASGSNMTVDVQFNADGLEAGVYEADIQVSSNDPVTPTVQIPAYFNVEGNPSLAVSANAFDFSEVFVNDHATDTLTLYNSGCDTLKLTDITGTTEEFAVDTAELNIMPYDSAQIAIAFAPAGIGNFSETLTLNTNAGNASVDVSGQGISAPEIAASPDSLAASVTQCGSSVTQTLTIENTGGNDLEYQLYGDASSSYDSTSVVYFTTDGEATDHNFSDITYADTLYITVTTNGDYDSGSEYTSVYINGEFIEDIEDNDVENGTEIITDYTFSGSQLEDWLQDDQVTVTIQNSDAVGAFSVNLHQVQVQGKGASWMEIQQPNGTLPAGDLAAIDVQFNADGLYDGLYQANLEIQTNDPVNPQVTIPASFTVDGQPEIAFAQSSLDFGELATDVVATKTVALSNTGCDTLFVNDVLSSSTAFTPSSTTMMVLPGGTANLHVTFHPDAAESYAETLSFYTNAGDTTLQLNGTGTAESTYMLSFNVSDGTEALENASISINGNTLVTDASGQAGISFVDGSYPFTISKSGFDMYQDTAVISGGALTMDAVMTETVYEVLFTVTDGTNPVENADILIDGTSLTTDANGEATAMLTNGSYTYEVTAYGFADYSQNIDVAGSNASESVTLTPFNQLSFTVTDGTNAVENASISIDGNTLSTDANGDASIMLDDGTYTYNVSAGGYEAYSASVTVSGTDVSESVTLTPFNQLNFTVTDGTNAVENASISIGGNTLSTDANGDASILLDEGQYIFDVTATGFADYTDTLNMGTADTSLAVALTPLYQASFTVTDGTQAVADASISINNTTLITDGSGQASIMLPFGTYSYTISATDYETYQNSLSVSFGGINVTPVLTEVTAQLSFAVTDGTNPIEGAGVNVADTTLLTDASGNAAMVLPNGTYNYNVQTEGYTSASGSIDMTGTDQLLDIVLQPGARDILFTVQHDGSALENASIAINGTTLSTDAAGEASIALTDGNYPYTVNATGYAEYTDTLEVAGNDMTPQVTMSLPTYRLRYYVRDAGGNPLENASISINGSSLTTDASGVAEIHLQNGTYSYTVNKTGYNSYSSDIIISDASTSVNLNLTETVYTATFQVEDASGAIEGATINVAGETLATDASGLASTDLTNGTYSFTAEADGYNSFTGELVISGAAVTKDVLLNVTTYPVSFTVTDANGALENVSISIDGNNLTTNASGQASIDLPNGTYNYSVSLDGYENATGSVVVNDAGTTADVTLQEVTYNLAFRVLQIDEALEGATIAIEGQNLTTDASGEASLQLPAGTYSYTVNKDGYHEVTQEVTLDAGTEVQQVYMSEITYAVEFTVTDGANPLEDALLTIDGQSYAVDEEGKVNLNLSDGTYSYTANATNYNPVSSDLTILGSGENVNVALDATEYTVDFAVSSNGTAIDGATVTIDGQSLNTNAQGEAAANLPVGTYTYTINDPDYEQISGNVQVTSSGASVDAEMEETTYPVTFTVDDGATALDNATISINGQTLYTGFNGTADISLPNGTYSYTVNAQHYDEEAGSVNVYRNAEDLTVSLNPTAYDVSFEVQNAEGENIPNATINVDGTSLITDAGGNAETQLTEGTYSFDVTATDYVNYSGNLNISGNTTAEVTMERVTWQLGIQVTDGTNNLSNAKVLIDGQARYTNASGEVSLNVPDGTYSFEVRKAGFAPYSGSVTVNGADVSTTAALTTSDALYTVLFDVTAEGSAKEGASISIAGETLTTDANGQASLELGDGSWNYTVNAPEYKQASGSFTLSGSGLTESVTLQPQTFRLSFTARDAEDTATPVTNADVSINGQTLTTNSFGRAIIDLEKGDYSYSVTAEEYEAVSGNISITGTDEEITLDMQPVTYPVSFEVSGTSDALGNASIQVAGQTLTTDADGKASLELRSGSYNYAVTKSAYQDFNGTLTVSGAAVTEAVQMQLAKSQVSLHVLHEGQPLEGASVSLADTTLTTNVSGLAYIQLAQGEYSYTVMADDFVDASGNLSVGASDFTETVNMSLITYTASFALSSDGQPLADARIRIDGQTLYTDNDGEASISLVPGNYGFTAEAVHYRPYSATVNLSGGDASVEASLEPQSYSVNINVKGEGESLEGASVTIADTTLVTDAWGDAFLNLEAGTYSYTAAAEGYHPKERELEVDEDGAQTSVNLSARTYSVGLKLTDGNLPIQGATITIANQQFTTDSLGEISLQLSNGTYGYRVNVNEYVNVSGNITVDGGDTIQTVIMHETAYPLQVHITDQSGDPLQGVTLTLSDTTLVSNEEGVIAVQLQEGTYDYSVTAPGFEDISGTLQILDMGLVKRISLSPLTYSVDFVISDANGPLEGATVNIAGEQLVTNAEGKASVSLPDGNYNYYVDAEGYNRKQGTLTVAGESLTENLTLVPVRYRITFNVTENGNPLQGATISLPDTTLNTDATGAASIRLTNGTYNYTVSAAGYDDKSSSLTVDGGPVSETVSFGSGAFTLTFSVSDESGAVEGATITVNDTTLTTGADGEATLALASGTYSYTVSAEGYGDASGSVTIEGADLNVEVSLAPTGLATGNAVTIKVYPNPAAERVTIDAPEMQYMELMNLQGQLVISRDVQSPSMQLDVSTLKKGLYLLYIRTTDGRMHTRKLMVR